MEENSRKNPEVKGKHPEKIWECQKSFGEKVGEGGNRDEGAKKETKRWRDDENIEHATGPQHPAAQAGGVMKSWKGIEEQKSFVNINR